MTGDFIKYGLIPGFLIRLGMIIYSVYHDEKSSMKYTDIDYQVFTDAAQAILTPTRSHDQETNPNHNQMISHYIGSPYDRATYRYTPLLALLLTPNHFIHPCWGKFLFLISDLIIGYLLFIIRLEENKNPIYHIRIINFIWLLNPFVINISTRGSSEPLLGVIIIGFLCSAKRQKWDLVALLLGLAVHFKIYPFIYGVAVLAHLRTELNSHQNQNLNIFKKIFFSISNSQQIRFTTLSLLSFLSLNLIMFSIWGYPFIHSSYFYHLNRLDHRHNFSPYFYPIYLRFTQSVQLNSTHNNNTNLIKITNYLLSILQHPLSSFIPQISISLILSTYYGKRDLTFGCFISTYSFVIFNKVCTSQYFIWYLWFIPLFLHKIHLNFLNLFLLFFCWVFTQLVWLYFAFQLEFNALDVFFPLWSASILFFSGHSLIVALLILGFSHSSSSSSSHSIHSPSQPSKIKIH